MAMEIRKAFESEDARIRDMLDKLLDRWKEGRA
jgi:hypothetical protein